MKYYSFLDVRSGKKQHVVPLPVLTAQVWINFKADRQTDNVFHKDFWYNYIILEHQNEEASVLKFAIENVTCSFD